MSISLNQITIAFDRLSVLKRRKHLTDGEREVLAVLWEGKTFKEVALHSKHTVGYLRGPASHTLRSLVRDTLGRDEEIPVTKHVFRRFVEQRLKLLQELVGKITQSEAAASGFGLGSFTPSDFVVIGGEPPGVSDFFGRFQELEDLQKKISEQVCVNLVGAPGIGKSALASKLVERLAAEAPLQFDTVVWKSIFYSPVLEELLSELNLLLSQHLGLEPMISGSVDEEISSLLGYLRACRCLLILDSVEAVLQGQSILNQYGERHAAYGLFLRRLVEEQHRSRVLVISRKPLTTIMQLAGSKRSACGMQLGGLDEAGAWGFLRGKRLLHAAGWKDLVYLFRGNPQALQQAQNQIEEFFNGDVSAYLRHSITIDPYFLEVWDEQFGPDGSAPQLERWIIPYLANQIEQGVDPVPFSQMLYALQQLKNAPSKSNSELMLAVKNLTQEGLVETHRDDTGLRLSLIPMMKKYVGLRAKQLALSSTT